MEDEQEEEKSTLEMVMDPGMRGIEGSCKRDAVILPVWTSSYYCNTLTCSTTPPDTLCLCNPRIYVPYFAALLSHILRRSPTSTQRRHHSIQSKLYSRSLEETVYRRMYARQ